MILYDYMGMEKDMKRYTPGCKFEFPFFCMILFWKQLWGEKSITRHCMKIITDPADLLLQKGKDCSEPPLPST